MKPVDQNIFSNDETGENGNCFTACLASLLELPIEDVPDLRNYTDGEWVPVLRDWLMSKGFKYTGDRYPEYMEKFTGVDGFMIVGGGSPRGFARGHAVIYKDGILAHDPHPSRAGLTKAEEVYLISRLDNAEFKTPSSSGSEEAALQGL